MSELNHHHEEEFQDMDYVFMKIGKSYNEGKTLREIAVENKRPVSWVKEILAKDNLY